jgi:hypothetical protein
VSPAVGGRYGSDLEAVGLLWCASSFADIGKSSPEHLVTRSPSSLTANALEQELSVHTGLWIARPDSNWGHHDFQSWARISLTGAKSLQWRGFGRSSRLGQISANCSCLLQIWAPRCLSVPKPCSTQG